MVKKILVVFAMAALFTVGVGVAAGGTNFWQHVITTITPGQVTTQTVTAPTVTVDGHTGYYWQQKNGQHKCEFKHDPPNHADWNGPFLDSDCTVSALSTETVTGPATTVVSTVCNTDPTGATAGPFSDENCTVPVTTEDVCPNIDGVQTSIPVGDIIDGEGNCVPAPVKPVTPIIPQVDNMFLCYSKFQTDSGLVVPIKTAIKLLAAGGYWLPNAVSGNAVGFANIGGYHLVCNAPGTLTGFDLGNDQKGGVDIVTDAQALLATLAGSPEYYPIVK